MARGTVPDSEPLNLGMPGMHGTVAAVTGLQKSDLIIALGARFDDRVTGQLSTFAPHAKVIHADIDPAEISKNRIADVPIVGDVGEVIQDLIEQVTLDRATGEADADAAGTMPPGASASPSGSRPSRSATPTARTERSRRSTSSSASAR